MRATCAPKTRFVHVSFGTCLKMRKTIKFVLFISIFVFEHECSPLKKPGYGPGEQDWGWIDVRTGSHMFFWLYFTTANINSVYDRPLLIWLQGGPGSSSTGYGNFAEIGPLHINGSERRYAWTKQVNVLFIDNPVGTGFSYVDNVKFLTVNNVQIGADMVVFLTNFYQKFPNFKRSPMYIVSESYGGKMATEIGKQLYEHIKSGKLNINFKGIALGDSWISPVDSVLTWAPLLLNVGLINERSYNRIMKGATEIKTAVDSGRYDDATTMWASLEAKIMEETNNVDFYNVLHKVAPINKTQNLQSDWDFFFKKYVERNADNDIERIMNGAVKEALDIPSNVIHGNQSSAVFNALRADFMKPVTHVVEHLLNNTELEIVVFSGQLDLIVDTYGTLRWVDHLRWKGSSTWHLAKREPLTLDGVIEGYKMKALNLCFYWINRAGHMVPTDNPKTAMELLRRITKFDEKAVH